MRYIVGGKDYSTRFIKEAVEKAIFDGAIDSNEDAPYEGARAYGISVETVHGTIVAYDSGGDEEHPGVFVDLERERGGLAMGTYCGLATIEQDGEGCGLHVLVHQDLTVDGPTHDIGYEEGI